MVTLLPRLLIRISSEKKMKIGRTLRILYIDMASIIPWYYLSFSTWAVNSDGHPEPLPGLYEGHDVFRLVKMYLALKKKWTS